MRLRTHAIACVVSACALSPTIAHAQDYLTVYCGNLPGCGQNTTDIFPKILRVALGLLPTYLIVIGALFVMIGGAKMLLSAGNEERVTSGRNTIIWALVGISVANFAETAITILMAEVTSYGGAPGSDIVMKIVNLLRSTIFDLMDIALLGVALLSGMRMVLSRGKEDEFTKGRSGVVYATVGAIVINIAERIVTAVLGL